MAITTTPVCNYEPYTPPAPNFGTEPKRPIDEEPLAFVADQTLSKLVETNSILLEICNVLACSDLLKNYPGDLRSSENIPALIHNSYDAANANNAAARLIRRVLIGGEF